MPTLLVLTALRYEALAIAKRLGMLTLSVPTESARLRIVGPRCVGLSGLQRIDDCRGIVMAGLCGAIDPALRVGDIVVDCQSTLAAPAVWRRGEFQTTSDIVATPAQKQALFAATGAIVVDMENAIARDFAERRGLPFLGIRAVSDSADDPLDPAALRWIDTAGNLRPMRVAADVCRRPRSIAALWRLGRRSRVAVRNLADAVRQIAYPSRAPAAAPPGLSGRAAPRRSTA